MAENKNKEVQNTDLEELRKELMQQFEEERENLKTLAEELKREKEDLDTMRKELTDGMTELMAAKTQLDDEKSKLNISTGKKAAEKPVKMVKVELEKTKEKKSDVPVTVNGKVYLIQRGVEVEVPDFVAEVLENTKKMDRLALERQEEAAKNFA